jgi:signal transduction histidine kinase
VKHGRHHEKNAKGERVQPRSREQRNITILTVDDNDALRYSLSRSLKGGGYDVIEARNGAEALRMADQDPDLITLDVQLPDTDGFELCRILKSNPRTSHIPVLHISATFVETEYRVKGLEAGADGYLSEPISRDELLATVGALLRLKQAERESRLHAAEAEKARQELEKAHDELELRVQERTRQLADRNEEIRELTGRLLRLQDEERRRLARELHDSTGQMLTAMKMILNRLAAEETEKASQPDSLLSQAISINDDMSRQLRTMSYLLHPPLLDEIGLSSALHWYTEGFSQRSDIRVDLEISPDFGRLPTDMEITLFRVVQECLTNVHRHSASPTAKIRLLRSAENIQLEISDAGHGIRSERLHGEKVVPGIGIMGIEERVRQFGGDFQVKSSNKGTTVTATLPVKEVCPD